MLCTKFGWISLVILGQMIIKCCQFIFAIQLSFPFGKRCGFSFEKNWIPFTIEYFVPSSLELAVRFYRRKFLNVVNGFLLFAIISLEKGDGHSFQQPLMSFIQGCYMASLIEIGVYRQTDGWTTYDGQQIRKAHLSLDELNTELCLWISTVLMINGWSLVLCGHFWMMYLYPFEGWCQLFVIFHKVHHKEENGQSQTEHPP